MRIIIIGAVAAGTSAAAKARRNNEDAEIVIYERDQWISYSGCGMPYYLAGEVEDAEELTPRDPEFFHSKYNVEVLTQHDVLDIHSEKQQLTIRDVSTAREFTDFYDVLILATGATPVKPPVPGVEANNVFTLRNIGHMHAIRQFMKEQKPKTAVIVGSGFIGLEMCESLTKQGISVQIVERLPQLTPGLDSDMAPYVTSCLHSNGIQTHIGDSVRAIEDRHVTLDSGKTIPADMVLLATGVLPNTELASKAGVQLGTSGAIVVDTHMKTSVPHIFACGDCCEQFHLVSGQAVYRPLGSTANKTGRIAGDRATGGSLEFRGILGTGIFRIFDKTVAQTGLSEREAKALGYTVVVCHNTKPDRPAYMSGKEMTIKAIADHNSGRLIGVQIIGGAGVDKRLDVFATAISFRACVEDLFHLDLGYAPPYSTTKDPVLYTGMILDNAINRGRKLMTSEQLKEHLRSGSQLQLIDTRATKQYTQKHIDSARNIPHADFRNKLSELDPEKITVTYCNKGTTGNATQNILLNKGFTSVFNLSGGHKHYSSQED